MSVKIEYNGKTLEQHVENNEVATLPVANKQMKTDLKIKNELNLQSFQDITPEEDYIDITPHLGYDGIAEVIVNPIPSNYKDVSNLTATAAHVLAEETFYGVGGVQQTSPQTGTLADYYTEGEYEIVLSVDNPREELDGAYRGSAYIVPEELTVTKNGTYEAATGKVISKVEVAVAESTGTVPDYSDSDFALHYRTGEEGSGELDITYVSTEKVAFEAAPSGAVIDTLQDSNFTASNIKSGVSIFGVTGTYSGSSSGVDSITFTHPYGTQTWTPTYTWRDYIESDANQGLSIEEMTDYVRDAMSNDYLTYDGYPIYADDKIVNGRTYTFIGAFVQ